MSADTADKPWYCQISRYQWVVFIACYLGGMFDGLDSTLVTAVVKPAITDLTHAVNPAQVSHYASIVTALFLLGWTVGGAFFGWIGDRYGRVKALTLSILIYALATGLCGLAQTWEQLALLRFLTALGIGGELIVGTTLLAESWPERYRCRAVGVLTTAYQAGVLLVGFINSYLGLLSWRYLFFVGALPALLVMFIRCKVEEPDQWKETQKQEEAAAKKASILDLFTQAHLRQAFVAGTFTGVMLITYWASSFWIPTWIHELLPKNRAVQEASNLLMLQGFFAIIGATSVGFIADKIGRRPALAIAFTGYFVTNYLLFSIQGGFNPQFYLWESLLGFFIGQSIGICYIYVPELFPTRIRGTGTGFCFNMGRVGGALGVIFSSELVRWFGGSYPLAAISISYIILSGALVVWLAPETKGKTLAQH